MRSQDLIISKSNDSIQCKITKLKKNNIYFVFKNNQQYQSTLIPLTEIVSYEYNFDEENRIPKEKIPGYIEYSKVRISLQGGYSYQIGKINDEGSQELREYLEKLRPGYHFGGDFTYYFAESFGVGVKYQQFRTSTDFTNVVFFEAINNGPVNRLLKDDISISFIGALLSARLYNKAKLNAFFFNTSIGYMTYSNNAIYEDAIKLKGNTLGFASDIGYDIGIADNLSLGFQLSTFFGQLSKLETDNGTSQRSIDIARNEGGGLGRFDLSIGLRFNL
ncbi:hypothetical protein AAY42_07105 [Flagellimonas eckloniae]|uniref:Outer membrane protein beta-barrel domain-containing protein n=2 Tax=Flagellimonas eckloniae TaxID=346185 RepID=A0A0Q1CFX3_9FLAO|nr:hypothetical protein AAY42_07105 [Allomuricauda eckloniae]